MIARVEQLDISSTQSFSMSISIRISIRWLPDEASEPTTTVVLTSPKRRFVDIRILNPDPEDAQHNNPIGGTLPHPTSCRHHPLTFLLADILPPERLDWAFAGTSTSELRFDAEGKGTVHGTWHHWVSNRDANVDGVVDEGDNHSLPNDRTLETGNMTNPATGEATDYEEIWLDAPVLSTGKGEGKLCAVLVLEDGEHEARGMVVRVGQFCQGVLRVGEGFTLERWEWREEGGWRREVRMGDLWVPCGVLLEGERVAVGGEVRFGEFVWKVVEVGEI